MSLKYFNIYSQTLDFMAFLLVDDTISDLIEIKQFIMKYLMINNNQKFIDAKQFVMEYSNNAMDNIRLHSSQWSFKNSIKNMKQLKDSRDRFCDEKYPKHLCFDINPNHLYIKMLRNKYRNKQQQYDQKFIEKFYFDAVKYVGNETRKEIVTIKYIDNQQIFNHNLQQIMNNISQKSVNKNITVTIGRSYDVSWWKRIIVASLNLDFNIINQIEIFQKKSHSYFDANTYVRQYGNIECISIYEFYWEFVNYNTLNNYSIDTNGAKMLYRVDVFLPGEFPESTQPVDGIPCIYSFEYFKRFNVRDLMKYLLKLFEGKYRNKFDGVLKKINEWKKGNIEYYPFVTTGKFHWGHVQYKNVFDVNKANSFKLFKESNDKEESIAFNQPYRILLFFIPKDKDLDDEDLFAKNPDEEYSDEDDYYGSYY
eukprot:463793_1